MSLSCLLKKRYRGPTWQFRLCVHFQSEDSDGHGQAVSQLNNGTEYRMMNFEVCSLTKVEPHLNA